MYSIRPQVSIYARQVLVEGFCTTQRTLPSLLDNLELDLLLLARACVEDGATPVSKSKSKQLSSFAARLLEEKTVRRVISAIVVLVVDNSVLLPNYELIKVDISPT